jgi:hypothetical protein
MPLSVGDRIGPCEIVAFILNFFDYVRHSASPGK